MKQVKHTPTPWVASACEGGWDCVRAGDHNGPVIAKLILNEPGNAEFIAAACNDYAPLKQQLAINADLVAALEAWQEYFKARPQLRWNGTPADVLCKQTDAALAKARGER